MAIYHFSGQILGRAPRLAPDGSIRPGSKAVAAAAYRAGERLTCLASGESHDYSRRKGVAHSEIMAPEGSAAWLKDRALLWGRVEQMEVRKDAQLAREFNMALPHELSHEQRVDLVRSFVQEHFVRLGMVADVALHDPIAEQGQNMKNFHAHVMLTLRRATPSGLDPVKTREWNSRELLKVWRAEWGIACNGALERAGHKTRVDHRKLEEQRDEALRRQDYRAAFMLDRDPEIHVGPQARKAAQQGRAGPNRSKPTGARRRKGGMVVRRERTYTYTSYAPTRLSYLERILAGNDRELRKKLEKQNRRFDRLSRKLDYWDRQSTYWLEGQIMGKEFRFNRWKAAQEEKERKALAAKKAAHAKKRAAQIKELRAFIDGVIRGGTKKREEILVRSREVANWVRAIGGEERSRGRGRER